MSAIAALVKSECKLPYIRDREGNPIAEVVSDSSIAVPYKSPYERTEQPQSPKRRHDAIADRADAGDEKRQRVDAGSISNDGFDIAALIAKASNSAIATATEVGPNAMSSTNTITSPPPENHYKSVESLESDNTYLNDPQVYMRWSSSPILENLVGGLTLFNEIALYSSSLD
jgi:hypothetical protein